jgi:prolyl oligopeptidase
MTKHFSLFFLLLPFFGSAQLKYPETKKGDVFDEYFGSTVVPDPYRWLEDDNSEETKAWVKEENKVTFGYLATLPDREKINSRLKQLWNYTKYSSPSKKGKYYYFYKNDGLQNQSVLYRQEGITGKPEIFLDPNSLNKEGIAAIGSTSFSKSGKYFAYTVSVAGSDWKIAYVMETATKKLLNDRIRWIKFGSFSWKADEGFYYSGYDKPDSTSLLSKQNRYNKVFYHKLGTDQIDDEIVYRDMDHPLRYCNGSLTEDGRFLIAQISEGTSGSEIFFIDTKNPDQHRFRLLIPGFKTEANVIDNKGGELLICTNDNAPNYKVIRIEAKSEGDEEEESGFKTEEPEMEIIIPEKDMALQNVSTSGGFLFAMYLKDASTRVYQYSYDGKLIREIKLPGIGTASGFSGEKKDKELFYTFTSFNTPPQIYRYDIATGKSTIFRKTEIKINTADFVTRQVFFPSKDGTKIPMFLTYKKDLKMDGNNPTLIYGYGGFNIPLTPSFSISNAFFIEQGGIYAVVNLRGGSEYGEKWHRAGMLDKKQNVFDDFVFAAEYLVEKNYTNKTKIAIKGGSNGGLLVGAVITQRPDICKVALPAVGVMDMLRFHRFTVGHGWVTEYGSSDSAKDFQNLFKYSPYHNLQNGTKYPATLVTSADHDDRVVPAHSFKFAARLQEYNAGDNPVLIRIETNAGHGAGKPTTKQIDEAADVWSFVMHHLEMPYKEQAVIAKPGMK